MNPFKKAKVAKFCQIWSHCCLSCMIWRFASVIGRGNYLTDKNKIERKVKRSFYLLQNLLQQITKMIT